MPAFALLVWGAWFGLCGFGMSGVLLMFLAPIAGMFLWLFWVTCSLWMLEKADTISFRYRTSRKPFHVKMAIFTLRLIGGILSFLALGSV